MTLVLVCRHSRNRHELLNLGNKSRSNWWIKIRSGCIGCYPTARLLLLSDLRWLETTSPCFFQRCPYNKRHSTKNSEDAHSERILQHIKNKQTRDYQLSIDGHNTYQMLSLSGNQREMQQDVLQIVVWCKTMALSLEE